MMKMRARTCRVLRNVAAGLVLSMAVAACSGGGGGGAGAADDGTLSVMVPIVPRVLDPTQVSSSALAGFLPVLEPLVQFEGGKVQPLLASSYASPDPLTYVLTLNPDATFSDGTPFTAEDAVFSLGLHQSDTASVNASLLALTKSNEVTGEGEVTITLAAPDPQFLGNLTQVGMVSKKFYSENGDKTGLGSALNLGTGPYTFAKFAPSQNLELAANPKYWGAKKPAFKKISIDVVSDSAARIGALQSGEYDGIFNIPLPQVEAVKAIDSLALSDAPDPSVYKFNLNVETAPWDDVHLRRAFELALDREGIAEGALKGMVELAPSLVPPSVMSSLAGEAETTSAYEVMEGDIDFDLDAARAEMAQSSHPKGVEAEVLVIGSDPTLALIVQAAAPELAKIGINLKLREVDEATYYAAVYFEHNSKGVTIDLFSASGPDASNLPMYMLSEANAKTVGGSGLNVSDYINPAIDKLLDESRQLAADDPVRGKKMLAALKIAQADVPYVPVAFPTIYFAGGSNVDMSTLDGFWYLGQWPETIAKS